MELRMRQEYRKAIYERYRAAGREERGLILDDYCRTTKQNRKYAITLLNLPRDQQKPRRRGSRRPHYGEATLRIAEAVWRSAGYPWSQRLTMILQDWMPWIRRRYRPGEDVEAQLLSISARQLDRRLGPLKKRLKRRLYGRTKPGTLLKHHIPIRAAHWNVRKPGWLEVDLVSHSGNCASGEFVYSLNVTDIQTGWVETRAVMGKGEVGVVAALEEMERTLPFALKGIDSDNGSEFINAHLYRHCKRRGIEFTRGRAYKKQDNAHVEQKNWTHVRRLMGYERYDTKEVVKAMNEVYRGELGLMMNLFQPSVKLKAKLRVGSRLRRKYDMPQTPLERLKACGGALPERLAALEKLKAEADPFVLSTAIDQRLAAIHRMANQKTFPSSPHWTKRMGRHRQEPRLDIRRPDDTRLGLDS